MSSVQFIFIYTFLQTDSTAFFKFLCDLYFTFFVAPPPFVLHTAHMTSQTDDLLDPLVARLIDTRKQLKYTQQNLADMAGISRRALAAIETGGDCTLSTLRALSRALDLEIELHSPSAEGMPTLDDLTDDNRREQFGRDRG